MPFVGNAARAGLILVVVSSFFAGVACDAPTTSPDPAETVSTAPLASVMSHAPFTTWRQDFNHGTDGWVTDDVAGPEGWCGDIDRVHHRDGDLEPSGSRAYATVREGDCNAFHQGRGFLTSGPASGAMPLNRSFPNGGYVHRLDVYLDPNWPDGTGFGYAVSFQNLDQQIPLAFRYVMVPVMKQGGVLAVGGYEVTAAAWYTFHHRFYDDDGTLGVELQLIHDDEVLTTVPLSETPSMFWGQAPSTFATENTGSGYIWFPFISEGLDLPIDQQQLRRGQ